MNIQQIQNQLVKLQLEENSKLPKKDEKQQQMVAFPEIKKKIGTNFFIF